MEAVFFAAPADFRVWMEEHHARAPELLVGFYKRDSGRPSITWPESVDVALCFGWIDGVRRSLGAESYTIRFTPRKPRSNWSAVNIKRVGDLTKQGLMQPAGLAAFAKRADERSAIYSYEQRKTAALDPAAEKRFRANRQAWKFFQAQAPWYRRTATYWAISAKRAETREKRLLKLIEDSAQGKRIDQLSQPSSKPGA